MGREGETPAQTSRHIGVQKKWYKLSKLTATFFGKPSLRTTRPDQDVQLTGTHPGLHCVVLTPLSHWWPGQGLVRVGKLVTGEGARPHDAYSILFQTKVKMYLVLCLKWPLLCLQCNPPWWRSADCEHRSLPCHGQARAPSHCLVALRSWSFLQLIPTSHTFASLHLFIAAISSHLVCRGQTLCLTHSAQV